jgi:hypothetical protein
MSFFNPNADANRILETIEEMGQNHARASKPRTYWQHWTKAQIEAYNRGYAGMHYLMTSPEIGRYLAQNLQQKKTDTTPFSFH